MSGAAGKAIIALFIVAVEPVIIDATGGQSKDARPPELSGPGRLGGVAAMVALLAFAAGCGPRLYPLPPQRQSLTDPSPLALFVEMGEPTAVAHLVRDVSGDPEGTGWRWTYAQPELRFPAPPPGWKFVMDYDVVAATFRDTGPVVLNVLIGGNPAGTERCDAPGLRRFEAAVPAGISTVDGTVIVQAHLDRVWTAADGVRLGFTLHRAGFVP